MSDTGPAEIAEILANEEKRKQWTVLTLIEIRNDLKNHIVDDQRQFAELRAGQKTVSSSVAGFDALRYQGLGIKQFIIGMLVFIGGFGGFILTVVEIVKAWKSP